MNTHDTNGTVKSVATRGTPWSPPPQPHGPSLLSLGVCLAFSRTSRSGAGRSALTGLHTAHPFREDSPPDLARSGLLSPRGAETTRRELEGCCTQGRKFQKQEAGRPLSLQIPLCTPFRRGEGSPSVGPC